MFIFNIRPALPGMAALRRPVMKLIISFFIFFLLWACGNEQAGHVDHQSDNEAAEATIYTCPMHPSVISDRPGACPVCGMALVKKSRPNDLAEQELKNLEQVRLSPTQRILANVSTIPVAEIALSKMIDVVGMVDFAENRQATLSARFRGRVEKILVSFTGEFVSQGQPLVEIYSPDLVTSQQEFILALEADQTKLVQALRQKLSQNYGLTEEQITRLIETRQTQATVTFNSPLSGTVISKRVQAGQYVDEGLVLYQMADLSKVWIYLDVYEQDLPFIEVGQIAHIKTETRPDQEFTGRVTFIDPVINAQTRTVRIRTEFDNRHGQLKPQMFVRASLHGEGPEVLSIPSGAVLFTGKRTVVWVETAKNIFEPRQVTLGQFNGAEYEVLGGLKAGEMIAASGGYLLDSESSLQQPAVASLHAAHQVAPAATPDLTAQPSEKTVVITVDGDYEPKEVRIKLGQTIHLQFHRVEDSYCTSEVVFEELNLRRKLPAFKTTTISLTPEKTGQINFACGMDMIHGKLIVEK